MELQLTQIGNSQGVILPKTLIKQFGFNGPIQVELSERGILLSPTRHPRAGWEEQIRQAIIKSGSEILAAEDSEWQEIWEDEDTSDWTWDETR